ncbi:MAG: GNAT family N-acetyltransferase [Chloroflexi bacterium]|nr:GNAT family N-acetyltransferase [Chloroflexota bacterium]
MDKFVLNTPRLHLRQLTELDAEFILALYNDRDFIRNIADRGLRTIEDARAFIARGPRAPYAQIGHGLLCVEENASGHAVGICGLVKRDELSDSDIGFALLPEWRGRGYAREAASAVVAFARDELHLPRLLGIALPENTPSIRVLEAIDMQYKRNIFWPADGSTLSVYRLQLE